MKPLINTNISTASPQDVKLKPELLWPAICESGLQACDMRKTPTESQIFNKYKKWNDEKKLFHSTEFWDAATKAEEIRIIDPHLDIYAMKMIRELLGLATDIKILRILIKKDQEYRDVANVFEDLRIILEELGCRGNLQLKQCLDNTKFPYVHDRFAILDGELWHCGTTVGGLHHSLSALSRGWDDRQHEFKELFDKTWERS